MPRTLSVLALALAVALSFASPAVAKVFPVATTTTFTAVYDESSSLNELSGQLSSKKAVCRSERRFVVTEPSPLPPGFTPVTAGRSNGSGQWSAKVPGSVVEPGTRMTVIFKSKKIGNVLCKEAKKVIASATPQP